VFNLESKAPAERRRNEPVNVRNGQLCVGMSGVALGAIVSAAGLGRLFISDGGPDQWARRLLGIGASVFVAGTTVSLVALRKLPPAADDCARYGRHILGLTFALLVTGLCNAAGMCALALEDGLDFSADSVIEASNPAKVAEAEKKRADAYEAKKTAERDLRSSRKELAREKTQEAEACQRPAPAASAVEPSAPPSGASSNAALSTSAKPDACGAARAAIVALEDSVDRRRDRLEDATEGLAATEAACAKKKRALFFLLAISTITALFGAAFYVVNQVRGKRPPYEPNGHGSGSLPGAQRSEPNGSHEVATVTATATVQGNSDPATNKTVASAVGGFPGSPRANGDSTASAAPATATVQMDFMEPSDDEPFDVHKFWSGVFFRVGEAVLFTFTSFWLLWSSRSTEYTIWLPVLALFVGMFVKTGETVVFSLGQRILSAAEALLPAGPAERTRATPPRGAGASASGSAGARTVRDGKGQAQLSN
jgi:hypothetical protein